MHICNNFAFVKGQSASIVLLADFALLIRIYFLKGTIFMSNISVGIDLGGSHVAIGVVDNAGRILEQFEKDFTVKEKENLLPVAVRFIVDTLRELKQRYDLLEFGLGMAGAICNGVILRSVNLGVENYDIKTELENKTGLSVHIKNDAKCAALAEYKYGDIKQFNNIVFLTLGTGIGGAVIYHGTLMHSDCTEGYELGHMIIKAGGLTCRCGKKGCFETYGGILAFKSKVIDRLNLSHDIPGPELRSIMDSSIDKIADIIEEYIDDLSIGISNLINIFEPDCIVIGGGFARYDYMLLDKLKDRLVNSNLLFNRRNNIEIRVAKFGNDAGIIGASQL